MLTKNALKASSAVTRHTLFIGQPIGQDKWNRICRRIDMLSMHTQKNGADFVLTYTPNYIEVSGNIPNTIHIARDGRGIIEALTNGQSHEDSVLALLLLVAHEVPRAALRTSLTRRDFEAARALLVSVTKTNIDPMNIEYGGRR